MPHSRSRLTELAAVFLKLGTIPQSGRYANGFGTITYGRLPPTIGLLLIWRWRINVIWLISGSAIVRLVGQFAQSYR